MEFPQSSKKKNGLHDTQDFIFSSLHFHRGSNAIGSVSIGRDSSGNSGDAQNFSKNCEEKKEVTDNREVIKNIIISALSSMASLVCKDKTDSAEMIFYEELVSNGREYLSQCDDV